MDQWRVTVLGDGGVGKTALAVQVTIHYRVTSFICLFYFIVYFKLLHWYVPFPHCLRLPLCSATIEILISLLLVIIHQIFTVVALYRSAYNCPELVPEMTRTDGGLVAFFYFYFLL